MLIPFILIVSDKNKCRGYIFSDIKRWRKHDAYVLLCKIKENIIFMYNIIILALNYQLFSKRDRRVVHTNKKSIIWILNN